VVTSVRSAVVPAPGRGTGCVPTEGRVRTDIRLFELNSRYSEVRRISYPMDPMRRFQQDTPEPISPMTHGQLQRLAALLEWSYGFQAADPAGDRGPTRRAPSAGALYPTECFLISCALGDWAVYYYDFRAHVYYRLARPDVESLALWLEAGDGTPVVVLGSVLWRSAQRYGTRCYLYCLLDAGNVAGNLATAAGWHGLQTTPTRRSLTLFHEQQLGMREGEGMLFSLRVRDDDSVCVPMPAQPTVLPASDGHGLHIPRLSPVFSRIRRFHQRTVSSGRPSSLAALPGAQCNFPEAAERRRSAAAFAPEAVDCVLAEKLTGRCIELLRDLEDSGGPRLAATVVATRVAGWPAACRPVAPDGTAGHPTRRFPRGQDAGERLAVACQQQAVVRQCALAIVLQVDFEELDERGHDGFREAAIAAGAICADLYRYGSALRVGTTSIGGFSPEHIKELIGAAGSWPLVVQVFGVEERAKVKTDAAVIASAASPARRDER
jgi:nitroreductase